MRVLTAIRDAGLFIAAMLLGLAWAVAWAGVAFVQIAEMVRK